MRPEHQSSHFAESQGRQAPPGFDNRSTAPPQLTEPPPSATAAARGRLGPLPLQRPKPGPSPPISPAHARTQPGAMPPARPAVRSQRVPAAAVINTAPPAAGLTRPQLQPPIPLVKVFVLLLKSNIVSSRCIANPIWLAVQACSFHALIVHLSHRSRSLSVLTFYIPSI